jgi:hypothetical protein
MHVWCSMGWLDKCTVGSKLSLADGCIVLSERLTAWRREHLHGMERTGGMDDIPGLSLVWCLVARAVGDELRPNVEYPNEDPCVCALYL